MQQSRAPDGFAEANIRLDAAQRIMAEVGIKTDGVFAEYHNDNRAAELKKSFMIAFANSRSGLITLLYRSNGKSTDLDHRNLTEMVGIQQRHHPMVFTVEWHQLMLRIGADGEVPAGNRHRRAGNSVIGKMKMMVIAEIEPADEQRAP